ncbi:hypothetical protein [Actinokineospora cianjurensis]|uniref:hypothetical protein n=1 Tax=Actinokineospora cianjurensis TaxID=585224 RepID=UPI0011C44696|nr:hypothetical protein [Actinokineospora cianjurensis]
MIGNELDPTRVKFGDLTGDGRADLVHVRADGTPVARFDDKGFTSEPRAGEVRVPLPRSGHHRLRPSPIVRGRGHSVTGPDYRSWHLRHTPWRYLVAASAWGEWVV